MPVESGNGREGGRNNLDFRRMLPSELVKHLDREESRQELNARATGMSSPIIDKMKELGLTSKDIKDVTKLSSKVRLFRKLLIDDLKILGTTEHNYEQAEEAWGLFNEIADLSTKVNAEVKKLTIDAIAQKKNSDALKSTPKDAGTSSETTKSAPKSDAEPVVEKAEAVSPEPTVEKYESGDADRATIKTLEDRIAKAKDAFTKENNPASSIDLVKLTRTFELTRDSILEAISKMESDTAAGIDVSTDKKVISEVLSDMDGIVAKIEGSLNRLAALSLSQAPTTNQSPATPQALTAEQARKIEQDKRKAETIEEMNARIKAGKFAKHRVAYNRDWKGEKDLDKKIDKTTGEHPQKKRGEVIEAIDQYYKSSFLTKWGARARDMLGLDASKLPADIQQKMHDAEQATREYMDEHEAAYTKRIDERVASGSITPERREELMARYRVMKGNRYGIKFEERILAAEKASLPENQRRALESVKRLYARAPMYVKIGIGAGAVVGITAATGGLGAVATAGVAGKAVWRSVMIGTGAGAAAGSLVMRAATKRGQAKLNLAKENAQSALSGGSWKEMRQAIRAGDKSVRRGKVAGYATASMVGGASSAFAGGLADSWNDAVTSTPDVVPSTPTPNDAALDALKSQLENLHNEPDISNGIGGKEIYSQVPQDTFGPRTELVDSLKGDAIIEKMEDRVPSEAASDGVSAKEDLSILKDQERIPPATGEESVTSKEDIQSFEEAEDEGLDEQEGGNADEAEGEDDDSVPPTEYFTVEKGQHIWGIVEENFSELLDQLPDGHARDAAIMTLRDRLSENDGMLLKDLGVTSNHADLIHPGDSINMSKLEGYLQAIIENMTDGSATGGPASISLEQTENLGTQGLVAPSIGIEEPPIPGLGVEHTPPPLVELAEVAPTEMPQPAGTLTEALRQSAIDTPESAPSEPESVLTPDTNEEATNVGMSAALGAAGATIMTGAVGSSEAPSRVIGTIPSGAPEAAQQAVSPKELTQVRKRILSTIEGRGFLRSLGLGKSFFDQFKTTTLDDLETNYLAKKRGSPVDRRTVASSISAAGVDADAFDTWANNLERWKMVVPFVKTKTLEQYVDDVATHLIRTGQKV